jgi:hypothetical protein
LSRLEVKVDKFADVLRSINLLVAQQVLVGVPDSTTERIDEKGPMNNATLGYIHEFGSPSANIPARPFLIPGVENAQDMIESRLKKATQAALNGDAQKVEANLIAAGLGTADSARDVILAGDFDPLKAATIAARRRPRDTKSQRDAEMLYAGLLAQGVSTDDAQVLAGIKPLINTAQLMKSITYVLRKAK